ncbi:digestive cysteine proteinase 2-like [Diadema antillarum]|uniref:digestive cysteine proteinase 2-like n=1 Tax=Diadema antillarum TaxID=105358 RepID=UPI003A8804A1
MAHSAGVVLLLLFGVSFVASDPKKPVFKDHYHATGYVRLPYAELNEPFEVYFQGSNKRSRIDVYNGLDKTFLLGNEKPSGNTYKISPSTVNNTKSVTTCFKLPGDSTEPVTAQSMLPDLTHFSYYKSETRNGQMVDLWQNITTMTFSDISRKNVYTFAVSQTTPPKPVQYVMMGANSLLGSHFDKYIIDYDFYDETTVIPDEVFATPAGLECRAFPGPGMEHQIRANPFREMINPERGNRYHHLFDEFKTKFGKQYQTVKEHETRKGHFEKNVRMIHSVNRANRGYGLAINHLADITPDEFKMMRGRLRSTTPPRGIPYDGSHVRAEDVPDTINWNVLGAVSPVKDQAICGSCWSFGTSEVIEGAYFMKHKKRVRLSQQMLMDCTWEKGNNGCDGGEDWRAYEWLMENGGLETEETYGPYLGQNGMCHFNKSQEYAVVKNYTSIKSGNQTALKIAIAENGPASVGIDAAIPSFLFYSYGVFYDAKCGNTTDDLDHAVLAVGYGTYNGQDYWLVKNSWSTYWGNNGYVMISMKDNNCGVATSATQPILK